MTGSMEMARMAVERMLPQIGSGCTRRVYRDDDTVYKVPHQPSLNEFQYSEFNNMMQMRLPDGIEFPAIEMYNVDGVPVIAMQYINGQVMAECYCDVMSEPHDSTCLPKNIATAIVRAGIDDVGGMNVIYSNGTYFVIDAAV